MSLSIKHAVQKRSQFKVAEGNPLNKLVTIEKFHRIQKDVAGEEDSQKRNVNSEWKGGKNNNRMKTDVNSWIE